MCGDQRVSESKRSPSVSGPPIHRPASPFCRGCAASGLPGVGEGAVRTLSGPCSMLFSLPTQAQVTVSMLAEQEVCFSDPMDGANVIACVGRDDRHSCVSWIPPDPLVELYHWLQGQGTGGLVTYRERACAVLLLSLRSSFHIVDVRSAPSPKACSVILRHRDSRRLLMSGSVTGN